MRTSRVLSVVLVAVAFGCGPTIPVESRPVPVQVVYDPATGNLPTPNDLALVDGVVTIAPNALLSDAENALKATFNGHAGFSTGSSVRVQFTAAIDASTVSSSSVVAYDLGEGGAGTPAEASLTRTYAPCDASVSLASPTGFTAGHTYLFAVRGGDTGVLDENRQPLATSPAFHFLRAGKDLTQHADAMPGATRAEKRATAEKLEAVRQQLEPHFVFLESKGLPRTQVLALWTFTVHREGEALFDPGRKAIPFPNELLKSTATGLVTLPADPADDDTQKELKHAFNQLDGFSTTAALSVDFTVPVQRSSVSSQSVRLFDAVSGAEVMDLTRSLSTDGLKLVLTHEEPLLPGTPYVVVLSGLTDAQGQALAPMPLASVLSLGQPLLDGDGKSTVSSFCADTAKQLEPMRANVNGVLEKAAIARASVNAAWTFTTQDIAKRSAELWSAPYVRDLPLAVTDVASEDAPALTFPNTKTFITGKLTTWERLDPTTRAFREDGGGAQKPVGFILTLPKGLSSGDTVRVVVFGHGLNTERRLGLLLADRLAKSGFAMLAIDFAYHGERTVCLKNADCESGAVCASDGSCLKGGQPADFSRMIAIPGVPGPGWPNATGAAWVDLESLPATRDHFRQAILDLSAVTRLIKHMDWRGVTGGVALDGDDIKYVGISLGGIIGGEVSGVDPSYRSMLLNVGGAGLPGLMVESATFGPQLKSALQAKGIQENSPEYDQFLNAAKWVLDEVDPINLAPTAKRRPLVYADPATGASVTAPAKKLRLHMAQGDTVVPNTATRRLVKATGVDENTEFRTFLGSHGFLADPVEPARITGQEDMAQFLENN